MPLTEVARFAIAGLATVILAVASVSDVRSRKIPNACVLALIVLFLPWAVMGDWPAAFSSLMAAVVALAITFALYGLGLCGAGDSKLFAACALFAGMALLAHLAMATAMAGGVVALASIASRPQRAAVMLTMRGKGDFGPGIPYGVAISLGAVIILWGPLAGWLRP
ncbi:MAG TPA: prepilin peptidase [Caulobacteraceae bacterium]|jgi:prepilin peptidase CpaA